MFLAEHANVLLLYTITPMHAGSGSSTGAVDLPIQRERHTHRPIVQSSGVKGALRDACEQFILKDIPEANLETKKKKLSEATELNAVFGREGQETAQAGALSTSDAKVLFFPVRSSHAPFMYITCPSVLSQFARDSKAVGLKGLEVLNKIQISEQEAYGLNKELYAEAQSKGGVVLEDIRVTVRDSNDAIESAGQMLDSLVNYEDAELLSNALIISDADFMCLVETTCPIQTRIALGPNGTTSESGGNLWYQELMPADTLLYSLSFLSAERRMENGLSAQHLANWLMGTLPTHLQLGGDTTLGRGFCELKWISKGAQ